MKPMLKNFAKQIILLLVITFAVNLTYAQPGGQQGPPKLPNDKQIDKMVVNLAKELSLTDDQTEKISELFTSHFKELTDLMGDGNNSRPDRKVMEQMKEDFENDVKENLSKSQSSLYDAYLKKQESNRGGQGKQGRR